MAKGEQRRGHQTARQMHSSEMHAVKWHQMKPRLENYPPALISSGNGAWGAEEQRG